MAKSAILAIRIIADATKAASELTKAQRAAMSFKDKLGKASVVAGAALGAIGVGAKQCADAAADLQQSVGGVETVFGSSSARMLEWSRNAAQAAGLSQNSYNEMATVIGSQLQNMGMSVDQSADKTNELINLGADLSSMFGGTTAEAVEALSSALKGEMDPIEKYGISLNDATLKAQAASMGLGDLYAAGDRNAKMQATLAAITQQSAAAQGNFAREADTAQGQQQRANAAWQNAQAALGQALLPALTAGAQALAQFATWVQANTSWLTPLIAVVGGFAAAIVLLNTAWSVYNTVQAIVQATTISTAGAFKFLAGATGIGLLIAIIAVLVANWDKVKQAGMAAAQWIQDKWQTFTGWIEGVFDKVKQWGVDTWNGIKDACRNVVDGITGFFTDLKDKVTGVFDGIVDAVKGAFGWVSDLWGKITGTSKSADDLAAKATMSMPTPEAAVYRFARTISLDQSTRPTAYAVPSARTFAATVAHRPADDRPVTYNITVNGVLDGEDAARKIKRMLRDYDRKRGR